ncbi:sensor histidine kinase [Gordonia alkanivorans]|uniref:sensor histidine kinase n=1 Tax=Gordonia alkanivorans TaxID=84096 RepID=UPI00244C050D|nr:HAMP domain-containing sensor histidine kinase [Gordonia alkanivorans]MDH3005517.1 HAMP domain-containing sensor histidine kinase [Gordonia alkanivorans]MDH3014929.1 HAMP domain-containing sensor histidine kinase [Gordonia alkanivorans]MDH3039450.1 HAMP domain-containing sensor histidine kinase [Gordonia alkanivorans]
MRRRLLTTMIAVLFAVGCLLGIPLSVVAWWWVADNAHQDLDNRLKIIADQLIREEGADGRIPRDSVNRESFELLLPPNGRLTITYPDLEGTSQRMVVGADIGGPRLSESIGLGAAGTLTLSIPRDEVRDDQLTATGIVLLVVLTSVIGGSVVAAVTAGRIVDPLTDLADRAATLGRADFRTEWKMYGIAELDRVSRALADANTAQALRLEREREIAGDASHQLRSRLTAIQLRLEELTLHDDPAVVTEAEAALDQVERLATELDELVEASRADEPAPHFIDVGEMLTTLVEDFRHAFEAQGRQLTVEVDGAPQALTSQSGRLREAVSVLVDNALQHGRGMCRIDVSTLQAGELVRITVADEGEGVADEISAHIFRRGFSAGKRPGAGRSGVGLSLARALIEADGGRLELTVRRPPVFAIVVPARYASGYGEEPGEQEDPGQDDSDTDVTRDRVPHR